MCRKRYRNTPPARASSAGKKLSCRLRVLTERLLRVKLLNLYPRGPRIDQVNEVDKCVIDGLYDQSRSGVRGVSKRATRKGTAYLTTSMQVFRNRINAHDMTQILPGANIIDVRPVDSIELLHESGLEILMGRLPVRILSVPTRLVTKTVEFP